MKVRKATQLSVFPDHGANLDGRLVTGSARSLIWVPKVSSFYGITIFLYRNEGHHARPHVHARYSGEPASVDFDGELIAGSLPRRALALVADWAHLQELEENWEHARREEALEPIDPLP
jgi:hypothetical protein